jgi:CRP/FNR family transcriptional regulator, cyclic AMP receptor protein
MSPLSGIGVFRGLPDEALRRLETGALTIEARNDEEICVQDEAATSLYAITGGEGRVRIGAIDRRSKKLMVEIFALGDIFGEIGTIDGGPRTASAVVEGRVRLMRISAGSFTAVLSDTPQLGVNLARLLSGRLRRTFALFQDATFETVEVRLARQILYLGALQGRRTEAGIVLKSRLKQPDLADLLGTTTRSIVTVLNTWRAADIVRYDTDRAQLTIHREEALRALFET